jgi:hypothetical protein
MVDMPVFYSEIGFQFLRVKDLVSKIGISDFRMGNEYRRVVILMERINTL